MIDPMVDPDRIFIVVAQVLSMPGVFGLIMAAIVAALMSTVDTLVTACSAVRDKAGELHFPKELERYAGFDKCDEVIVTLEL